MRQIVDYHQKKQNPDPTLATAQCRIEADRSASMPTVAKPAEVGRPSLARVIAAFLAIYLIWGSTYLAIRMANETLPPFLLAGARFVLAGTMLFAWIFPRIQSRPTLAEWGRTAVVGGLLLLGGNGGVVWSLSGQRVPSGLAALLVATVPIWIVVMEWVRRGGVRPAPRTVGGILLGFIGLAILLGPEKLAGRGQVDPAGAIVLVLASLSWAAGSIVSRHIKLPNPPLLATAMEMCAGGALLILFGAFHGDFHRLALHEVSARSAVAFVYLVLFGSLLGFTSYIWLLGVTTPARVSTYAYVNPVVAVLLGWSLGGEEMTLRTMIAAAVIIAAIVFITTAKSPVGTDRAINQSRSEP